MPCLGFGCGGFGGGRLFSQFFEKGLGKFWMILVLILVALYSSYFTMSLLFQKRIAPNQIIALKPDMDLFLSKNKAGYGGYIRFDTQTRRYPGGLREKETSKVKIVLQFQKDLPLRHAVKIELFDKTHKSISEVLLKKQSFVPVKAGYSYNICELEFSQPSSMNNSAYFRYSLIEEL